MANVGFIDSGYVLPISVAFTAQAVRNFEILEHFSSNTKITYSGIQSSSVLSLLTSELVINKNYGILEYHKLNLYNDSDNIGQPLNSGDFITQAVRTTRIFYLSTVSYQFWS